MGRLLLYDILQALGLLADFKLGQYCKLPYRVTFIAQIAGSLVGAVLNYVMLISKFCMARHYLPCSSLVRWFTPDIIDSKSQNTKSLDTSKRL